MTAQSSHHPRLAALSKTVLSVLLSAAFGAHAAEAVPSAGDQAYPGTIVLNVDATNTAQQIFQIKESIPVKAGHLVLLYPQWLPGNHSPTGPLKQLAGLMLTGNGKAIEWKRDPINVFAFHVEVPEGVTTLEAAYQFLSPVEGNQGRITMTDNIVGVQWNAMTLYPAGYATRKITVQPNLKLPAGFQFGTALETNDRQGDDVTFKPTDLETLVDSPLFSGRYFKRIDLDPGAKIPVHLNVVADDAASLETTPEQIEIHKKLIQQAYKLYKSQHYKHYDFLFSLSEEFGGIGLEHHQSSENGVKADYFTDWKKSEPGRDLLAHEYTHSWNGKFRRPDGQAVATFNVPLDDSLMWVYEGQTQYWGNVLAARAGLVGLQNSEDLLASVAARYDTMAGRTWRAVQDTTYDPVINSRRPIGWYNYQRSEDYYSEGQLIWLDADTKIRELSGDKKSLNDFAGTFFAVDNGRNTALPYSFEDVVKFLNAVQPYDWTTFLRTRLDGHGPGAPLDGLTRAGWKLVYTDTPTDILKLAEERRKTVDFSYSLGFSLDKDGKIGGMMWGGVAFKAGLSGNTTIMAVNGQAYKPELLKAAVKAAKGTDKKIDLLVKKGTDFRTVSLDYHDGLKYPRLERIPGTPDRLAAILAPMK
jgi:predicted metalloprotease with PDZ domain